MIDESGLSILDLMNFGTNYGETTRIDVNEIKLLFDRKTERKFFQKKLDQLKHDFIDSFRLPDPIVEHFFDYGKILLFESGSQRKQLYINYYSLTQIMLYYFYTDISHNELLAMISNCNDIDEVKDVINVKLKELRQEIKECSSLMDLEHFSQSHCELYSHAIDQVKDENGRVKPKEVVENIEQQLTAVIVNQMHLIDFVKSAIFNEEILEGINKEKFMFYLAGATLDDCSLIESTDMSIYYAINYYMHKIENGVPNINVTLRGNKYSFLTFTKKLKEYIKKHPDVDMVRFKNNTFSDFSPEEVKEYLLDFHKSTLSNFDIVETDEVYIPNGTDTGITRERVKRGRRPTRPQEISKLTLQKRKFYQNNKEQVYITLMGKNKFEGYIAHVCKNGYVVFEKHDRNHMISNQSGAAYIMTINNFNEFSKKSITEIREYVKQNPSGDIEYLCHSGNWMNRLQNVVDRTTGISLPEIERVLLKYKSNK